MSVVGYCSGRRLVALSMTWERFGTPFCAFEAVEQTLDFPAPRRDALVVDARGGVVEVVVERCAGIDVHQAQLTVCVRQPGSGRRRQQEIATFGTTTPDLLELSDWLAGHGVTQVAMEGTGVYWKPVYYVLEDAFELWLVNAPARQERAGP